MSARKKVWLWIAGVCFTIIVFLAGLCAGSSFGSGEKNAHVLNKENAVAEMEAGDFAPFWKAWSVLNEKYVPTKKEAPTEQEKVWGAIQGLANSYNDPYTVFFPPAEAKSFEIGISGNFEGIGMEVSLKDDIATVVTAFKDSPAYKAGIQGGDKILKINDQSTTDMTIDQAVSLIRGKKGTTVKLTIYREETKQTLEKSVVRDVINLPTIETELKKPKEVAQGGTGSALPRDGVFIIRLYSFSAISPNLFRQSLRSFVESGSHKLVLDLRGNAGGYLEAAVDMASYFLPAGKIVVSEDFGEKKEDRVYRSKGYDVFNENLRMVILVDNGTASASEILAGALREHGIAKLVGSATFGKAVVQELVEITDETSLKVTIARWLTPEGHSISDGGLKPDIEVKASAEEIKKTGKDPVLEKAIEYLNRQ